MRHITGALCCLALIVVLAGVNMQVLTEKLSAVDAALACAQEGGGLPALERAQALWQASEAYLCATVPHDSMDAVASAMTRAHALLRAGSSDGAQAELAAARASLLSLLRIERLDPGNIL